jgi:pimeloyl-ACP methyl ester carboxylesterase
MNLYPRLERIQVPTLVVVGELDLSTPEARGQALVERINGAQMIKVKSAHIAPPEIPNEYLAAVLPFIS